MTVVLSTVLLLALVAGFTYLLGCCNSALIISKYILHDDVRNHGSGNAGLTNFYRVFGKGKVVWVILVDLAKAMISTWLGGFVLGHFLGWPVAGKLIGGIFCILGHSFPAMFGFRGGKGVLCGAGVILMMDWRIAVTCLGVFVVLVAATRMVSLGSMVAAVLFPITCWLVYRDLFVVVLACIAGVLIVWRHKENAKRIAKGEENKLEFK
ncbi:MAG: glycerol-3-phosphate 1-O-acyltransferase PlsY [Oscillospiraceae bacterium]|nr:glycerol-3-phosphate 1-O-acyltransferase PlsY [Oscillospiraceae bacterium]